MVAIYVLNLLAVVSLATSASSAPQPLCVASDARLAVARSTICESLVGNNSKCCGGMCNATGAKGDWPSQATYM
jgi:hypothetical protein